METTVQEAISRLRARGMRPSAILLSPSAHEFLVGLAWSRGVTAGAIIRLYDLPVYVSTRLCGDTQVEVIADHADRHWCAYSQDEANLRSGGGGDGYKH